MKKTIGFILILVLAIVATVAMADDHEHVWEKIPESQGFSGEHYTSLDDTNHGMQYVYSYQEICSICNDARQSQYPDDSYAYVGSHSYDEKGYCVTCGHTCSHSHTEESYSFIYNLNYSRILAHTKKAC